MQAISRTNILLLPLYHVALGSGLADGMAGVPGGSLPDSPCGWRAFLATEERATWSYAVPMHVSNVSETVGLVHSGVARKSAPPGFGACPGSCGPFQPVR